MESVLEKACPCCHGPLERIEHVLGPLYGQVSLHPLYCGLRRGRLQDAIFANDHRGKDAAADALEAAGF